MLLTVDIGNTNIVLGVFIKEKLIEHFRISTDREKTEDEYGIMVISLLREFDINVRGFDGAVISSVVPPLTPIFEKMCEKYLNVVPLIVGPGIKTGINIKYENPREVGADRIVNAVAAYHKYKGPVIVVDFGTATTFDAISENFDYLGGAIAPGIGISAEALFQRTAKLHRIEIIKPERVIGRNTTSSIQAGVFYGYAGLVDHIVERMKEEMGAEGVKVIATGGLAPLIASETKTIDLVDSMLTLEGLRIIYEKNRQ
ncbi:MAG: type III pantothenate kinase [Thermovenabulum sp.]|uniref:type III pantothenate kinase n=1 Tax=Thermovenabulum sp. TaxID=3100335 RepID=UPI003C7C81BC